MLIATDDKITMAVPIIEVKAIFLAKPILPGSPAAVKNKSPVITQQATVTMPATVVITVATLVTMSPIIVAWAEIGKIKTMASKNKNKIFLFVNILF